MVERWEEDTQWFEGRKSNLVKQTSYKEFKLLKQSKDYALIKPVDKFNLNYLPINADNLDFYPIAKSKINTVPT